MYTADSLYNAAILDMWPTSAAAVVDFGMRCENAQAVYGALQWAIRHGTVTKEELRKAACKGPALTEIINRVGLQGETNPYAPGLTIKTDWDDLRPEDDLEF